VNRQPVVQAHGLHQTLALFLALAAGFVLRAQPPEPPGATFSANADLVLLNATVRTRKGGFVPGLDKTDFEVLEDGVPQTIRIFQRQDAPVAIGLVVDHSGSMRPKRHDVAAAALAFVRSSNPQDQMFIVNFNGHVSFGLPPTQLFSASPASLEDALNGVPWSGRTALYDAIAAGLTRLGETSLERKVLIVISDGGDNASHHQRQQVLDAAVRSGAVIYTIGLFDPDDTDQDPGLLKQLAQVSGGRAFLPRETPEIVPVCERIAEEIRNQYTIGYAPAKPPGDCHFRRIQVRVTARGGSGDLVRTRTGYISCPERQEASRP